MTRHVLLVDDDDDVRLIAATALRRVAGWRVTEASSAQTALAAAQDDPPDAVLLDVMMPGTDGTAALAWLRTDPRLAAIPVVMLTAKAQASDAAELMSIGAAGVVTKPFDALHLHEAIAAAAGWTDG